MNWFKFFGGIRWQIVGCIRAAGICFALMSASQLQAAVLMSESFETDGEVTSYTSNTEFKDIAGTSYFMRSNNAQSSGQAIPNGSFAASQDRRYGLDGTTAPYTGLDGTWAWVADNVDGSAGSFPMPASVTFNTVDATGYTSLQFSGLFGAILADNDDFLRVSYSLDNGPFTTGLYFAAPLGTGNAQNIYLDTDNNSLGDVSAANLLEKELKAFSFLLPDALSVQIRVEVSANAANDEFAFDLFQLTGDLAPQATPAPEPSMAVLLAVGVLFLRRRQADSVC